MEVQAWIEIRLTDELSAEELALVSQARSRIDYGMPAWGYQYAPKTWRVLAWLDGIVVSHAGILERTVEVNGQPVRVGGISGVWTLPEHRGSGLGSAVMRAAAAFLRDDLRAEFGLLICRDEVRPFYERLGWKPVTGPLVFDQPSGKITWPLTTMILPCSQSEWPEGVVDLRGLPW